MAFVLFLVFAGWVGTAYAAFGAYGALIVFGISALLFGASVLAGGKSLERNVD